GYDALLNVGAPIGAALLLAILAVGFSNRFIGRSVVRLERALEAAKAADQSKAAFLATLSHELKTPMNGVLGMVQILKRTELTERQSRIAATIESSADAQLSLINDLLSASKLQHGKFVLENAPFDVVAVAESVAEPSRLLAEEKGLTFRFEAPKSAHRLLGDETAVKQIMTNLASNAVKFTDEGEVSMRLEVDYFGGEAHVSLSVTDSGPGIDPSLHEAIFERFRQANDSLSRKAGGSGLGLAISRDLAALMGGDVAVKSAPGRGSTFVFTVALEGAEGAEADLAA
ncbi:MAG: ATP-binding protein, partial [Pseudomonadota bacterium]